MQAEPPEQAQAPAAPAAAEEGGAEDTYDDSNDPPMSQRGPCERCKQSKVKCDKALPKCNRCSRLGVVCVPRLKLGATTGGGGKGGAGSGESKRAAPLAPPLPPRPPALEAEVIAEHFIVALLQYGLGLRREPRQGKGSWAHGGGCLLRDLHGGGVQELVKASIALSNWASLQRRFGADFSRGALGAMEKILGPTPLPRLPPTAIVDIYPIACFRGLDACRDAPAELLTLDDGQSALCIIAERPSTISVHLNLPFEEMCLSYVDLCDLSARSTFHPLYAVARFVAETDIAEWCDAAAQAYLLGDGQSLISTIVKMYRNNEAPPPDPTEPTLPAKPKPANSGIDSGDYGSEDGSLLCLTRFRLVPVPETHTVFLAVQYTPLPPSSTHLLIPPPSAVPPRRTAAASANAGKQGWGWKKPPPTMEGKPLPRTNPHGITDVSAASFDALAPADSYLPDLPAEGSALDDMWVAPAVAAPAASAPGPAAAPARKEERRRKDNKGGEGGGAGAGKPPKARKPPSGGKARAQSAPAAAGGGDGDGGWQAAQSMMLQPQSQQQHHQQLTAQQQRQRYYQQQMQKQPQWQQYGEQQPSPPYHQQQQQYGYHHQQQQQQHHSYHYHHHHQQQQQQQQQSTGGGRGGNESISWQPATGPMTMGGPTGAPLPASALPPPIPSYAGAHAMARSLSGSPSPSPSPPPVAPAPPPWMPPEQVEQFRRQQLAFQQQMQMQQCPMPPPFDGPGGMEGGSGGGGW